MILSDDPEDVCVFVCGICQKVSKGLRNHVAQCHKLTSDEYRKLVPIHKQEYVRETYHRQDFFTYNLKKIAYFIEFLR
jgi:hypothetical protein